jgi:hypothetical protein
MKAAGFIIFGGEVNNGAYEVYGAYGGSLGGELHEVLGRI